MLTVETRQAVNPEYAKTLDTSGLRKHFLAQEMFKTGEIRLIYTHYDRFVIGGGGARREAVDAEQGGGNKDPVIPRSP